jgi:hypothetical protein
MPVELERKLKKEAKARHVRDAGAYVYGTLRKLGWTPSTQKEPANAPGTRNSKNRDSG